MYYPVKSVVTYNKYLNKEGNDVLAVPRKRQMAAEGIVG